MSICFFFFFTARNKMYGFCTTMLFFIVFFVIFYVGENGPCSRTPLRNVSRPCTDAVLCPGNDAAADGEKTGKVAKSTVTFAIVLVARKINDRDNSKFSLKTFSLSARDNGSPRINGVWKETSKFFTPIYKTNIKSENLHNVNTKNCTH